jgi:baculoviral IAP repeat-containing protein 6
MIFTDEPWYNEPGRETFPNKSASDAENSKLQVFTIQHAMLSWLNERLAQPPSASVMKSTPPPANLRPLSAPTFPQKSMASGAQGSAERLSGESSWTKAIPPAPLPPVIDCNVNKGIWTTQLNEANSHATGAGNLDDCIWGEVIRKHFSINARAIMETVKKWKGNKRNASEHAKMVTRLQEALTRHGFL